MHLLLLHHTSLYLLFVGGTTTTLTELDLPRPPRDLDPRREEDEDDDEDVDLSVAPSLRFHDDTAVRQIAARG